MPRRSLFPNWILLFRDDLLTMKQAIRARTKRERISPVVRRTVLLCRACGCASLSLDEDLNAWDGWRLAPIEICPRCLESGKTWKARDRYIKQVEEIRNGR